MSQVDEELSHIEYCGMRLAPDDPTNLSGVWDAEIDLPAYHATLAIRVSRWPNDWDNFMIVQRLAVQVMHEFNRSFRGYAEARRRAAEDDVPF